jgi:hypothetical protein
VGLRKREGESTARGVTAIAMGMVDHGGQVVGNVRGRPGS